MVESPRSSLPLFTSTIAEQCRNVFSKSNDALPRCISWIDMELKHAGCDGETQSAQKPTDKSLCGEGKRLAPRRPLYEEGEQWWAARQ